MFPLDRGQLQSQIQTCWYVIFFLEAGVSNLESGETFTELP